jgi:acetyl-CoA C-acetyltransferase
MVSVLFHGGISLVHSTGCKGIRQMVTGVNHVQHQGLATGLMTMCMGGCEIGLQ